MAHEACIQPEPANVHLSLIPAKLLEHLEAKVVLFLGPKLVAVAAQRMQGSRGKIGKMVSLNKCEPPYEAL